MVLRLLRNTLAWLGITAMVVQPAFAQGIVTGGSTGPNVLTAANGVPIVDVNAPNSAGVSMNTYGQFDVTGSGVILNNGSENYVLTNLGGYIHGNANMQGGPASLIINQVISADPSEIQGYIEVAGNQADVVIANPYGITCDGCGFINTDHVMLTTGTPNFNGDAFQGVSVSQGALIIGQGGADARGVSDFDLVARNIIFNGSVQGQRVRVIAGQNDVVFATGASSARPSDGTASAELAIDSSVFGGMYANKITIVSTEQGVGVKAPAQMSAGAGGMRITADGQLVLGQAVSQGNTNVSGRRVVVQKEVRTQELLSLEAREKLILEADAVIVGAAATEISATADIELGKNAQIFSASTLNLTAGGAFALGTDAKTLSEADMSVTTQSVDMAQGSLVYAGVENAGGVSQTADLEFAIAQDFTVQSGQVFSTGTFGLQAATLIIDTNATLPASQFVSTNAMDLGVGSANLGQAYIKSASSLAITSSGGLTMSGAVISASDALTLRAGEVSLSATLIETAADMAVTVDGAMTGAGDKFVATGNVSMTSGAFDLSGATVVSNTGDVAITSNGAASLDGTFAAADDLSISAATTAALSGDLTAQQSVSVSAVDISASGRVAANDLDLAASGDLTSSADLIGVADLGVTSGADMVLSGSVKGGHDLTITAGGSLSSTATLAAVNELTLTSTDDLTNSGSFQSGAGLSFVAGGVLTQSGSGAASNLASVSQMTMSGTSITQSGDFTVSGTVDFTATTGGITQSGNVIAGADLHMTAAQGIAVSGSVVSLEDITFDAASMSVDVGGIVEAMQTLTLIANTGDVTLAGVVLADDGVSVTAQNGTVSVSGTAGSSAAQLGITANALTVSGDVRAADSVTLTASGAASVSGGVVSDQSVTVNAATVHLAGQVLGQTGISVVATTGPMTSAASTILSSEGDIALTSQGEAQLAGSFAAGGTATVTVGGAITSSAAIAAESDLTVLAGSSLNNSGLMQTGGALDLNAGVVLTNSGDFAALEGVTFTAGTALANSGNGASAQNADAASVAFAGQSIANSGDFDVSGAVTMTATSGAVTQSGAVISGGGMQVLATGGALTNTGDLTALGALTLTTDHAFSSTGNLLSAGAMALTGASVTTSGVVVGNSAIDVVATTGAVAIDGVFAAGQAINITTPDAFTVTGAMTTGQDLTLTAVSVMVSATGSVDVQGHSDWTAQTGDITIAGQVLSDQGITLQADQGTFTVSGAIGSGSGDMTTQSAALDISGTVQTAGAVQMQAITATLSGRVETGETLGVMISDDLTLQSGARLIADDAVTLAADTIAATATRVDAASTLTMTSTGSTTAASSVFVAGQGATLTADGLSLTNSIAVANTGDLTLVSGGATTLSGTFAAKDNLTITATQAAGLTGTFTGQAGVTIGAADIAASGQVSGDVVALTSAQTVTVASGVDAGTSLDLTAGSSMALSGDMTSGGALTATAGTTLSNSGALTSVADLTLTAGTDLTQSGAFQTGATFALTAGGALYQTGNGASATGASAQDVTMAGQTVTNTGTFAANNDVTIAGSSGPVTLSGTVVAGRDVTITAQTTLTANGVVAAMGNLDATSGDIAIANGASVQARGTTELTAQSGGIAIAGAVTGDTGVMAAATSGAVDVSGSIQSKAGAVTTTSATFNVTGRIAAHDNAALTATGAGVVSGVLQTNDVLTLTGADLTLSGQAAAADGILITANTGNFTSSNTASLLSQGDVTLQAQGNAATAGTLQSGGTVDVQAGTAITSQTLIKASEAVSLVAGTDLTNSGAIQAGTTLDLTAGATLDNSAAFGAGGAVAFGAGAALTNSGLGLYTSQADAASVSMTGQSITNTGSFETTGALELISTGGAISNSGTLFTKDDLTATATGGDFTNTGTLLASVGMAVTTDAALSTSGSMVAGQSATLTGASLSLGGSVQSDGTLDLTATSGSMTSTGDITVAGNLTAGIAGQSDISGSVTVLGSATLTSASVNVTSTGVVQSVGQNTITAQTGNIDVAGLVLADQGIAIRADQGALVVSGTVGSRTGGVTATSKSLDISGGMAASGAIAATVANAASVTGTVASGDAMTLTVGDGLTLSTATLKSDAALTATAATITATNTRTEAATNQTLTATGAFSSTDSLLIAAHDLSVSAQSVTGTDTTAEANTGALSIGSQSDAVLSGTYAAGGNLTVTAVDLAALNGTVTALGTLTTNSDTFTAVGEVSGLVVDVNASGDLTTTANISAGTALTLDAGAAMAVSGTTTSNGTAALTAGSSLTNSGVLTANGDLTLTAATSLTNSGNFQSGGTATFTAGTALTQSGDGVANGGAAAMDVVLAGQSIDNSGDFIAVNDISMTASAGNISQSGTVLTGRNMALNATGQIGITGDARAIKDLTVQGAVVAVGTGTTVQAGNLATVTAQTGDIAINGLLVADQGVTLTSQLGALTNTGVIGSATGDVTATTATFDVSGSIKARGDIAITATGAGAISTSGVLASNGTLSVQSTTLTHAGVVTGLTGVTLTTTQGDVTTAATSVIGSRGGITVAAQTAANLNGLVQADGAVSVAAGSLMTSAALIKSKAGLSLSAGTSLENTGAVQAGGNLSLMSGTTLNNTAAFASGGDVTFTAGTALTNSGSGMFASNADAANLTFTGQSIQNSGSFDVVGAVTLNSTAGILQNSGAVLAGSEMTLTGAGGAILNEGNLVSLGSFAMSGDASVTSTGTIGAVGAVTISGATLSLLSRTKSQTTLSATSTSGAVTIAADLEAGQTVDVTSATAMTISADVVAQGDMTFTSGTTLDLTGDIYTPGGVAMSAQDTLTFAGSGTQATGASVGSLALSGSSIDFTGDLTVATVAGLTSTMGGVTLSGTLTAGTNLSATAATTLNVSGTTFALGTTNIAANDMTVGGSITSLSGLTATIGAGGVTNTGTIYAKNGLTVTSTGALTQTAAGHMTAAEGDLALSATALTLAGTLQSEENSTLTASGALTTEATIYAGGTFAATAQMATLNGSMTSMGTMGVTTTSGDLVINGSIRSNDAMALTAAETLKTNTGSLVFSSAGGVILKASNVGANASSNLDIAGSVLSNTTLGLSGNSAAVTGTLSSGTSIDLTTSVAGVALNGDVRTGLFTVTSATDITQTGQIEAAANLTATTNFTNSGTINSYGLQLAAQNMTNAATGVITSQSQQSYDLSGMFTNAGSMTSLTNIAVAADTALQNQGTMDATGMLALTTANLTNASGATLEGGSVFVTGASITNAGTLRSEDLLNIHNLAADGTTSIASTSLTNTGTIEAQGNGFISAASLTNSGTIQGFGGALSLTDVETLNNTNGTLFAEGVLRLETGAALDVTSAAFGDVAANGQLNLSGLNGGYMAGITIAAGQSLTSNGDLALKTEFLTNNGTLASGTGNLIVLSNGDINNTGFMYSGGDWTLLRTDGNVTNNGGVIMANTHMAICGNGTDDCMADLSVDRAASILNRNGGLVETVSGNMFLAADAVTNETFVDISHTNGSIDYTTDVAFITSTYLYRSAEHGSDGCSSSCQHNQYIHRTKEDEGTTRITLKGASYYNEELVINSQGPVSKLISGQSLVVNSGTFDNRYGLVSANTNINFAAGSIVNHGATEFEINALTLDLERDNGHNGIPNYAADFARYGGTYDVDVRLITSQSHDDDDDDGTDSYDSSFNRSSNIHGFRVGSEIFNFQDMYGSELEETTVTYVSGSVRIGENSRGDAIYGPVYSTYTYYTLPDVEQTTIQHYRRLHLNLGSSTTYGDSIFGTIQAGGNIVGTVTGTVTNNSVSSGVANPPTSGTAAPVLGSHTQGTAGTAGAFSGNAPAEFVAQAGSAAETLAAGGTRDAALTAVSGLGVVSGSVNATSGAPTVAVDGTSVGAVDTAFGRAVVATQVALTDRSSVVGISALGEQPDRANISSYLANGVIGEALDVADGPSMALTLASIQGSLVRAVDLPTVTGRPVLDESNRAAVEGIINQPGTATAGQGGLSIAANTEISDPESVDPIVMSQAIITAASPRPSTLQAVAPVYGVDLSGLQTPNAIDPSAPSLELSSFGNASLFTITTDAPNGFLVETRHEFVDLSAYVSSDYFLDLLNFDVEETTLRFGDALAETQLIRDQLFGLTGQRLIDGNVSEADQIRTLYENAAAAQSGLELVPGIALSPGQISALTENIVWLEQTVVNGQSVLVPRVYLAAGFEVSNGALIEATNVALNAGNVENNGTISAEEKVRIAAANNLTTTGGSITAGQGVRLDATDGILSISGTTISAEDITLVGQSVNVFNETTDTNIMGVDITSVTSVNTITAGNGLTIFGQDALTISGTDLSAGGDIRLGSDGDVTITSIEESLHFKSRNAEVLNTNLDLVNIDSLNGTLSIYSNGQAEEGGNVTLGAVQANAAGDIKVAALGGNVFLNAEAETEYAYSHTSRKGFLSSRSTTTEDLTIDYTRNTLQGSSVSIYGAGNVVDQASVLTATEGDISVEAVFGSIINESVVDIQASTFIQKKSFFGGLFGSSTDEKSLLATALSAQGTAENNISFETGGNLTLEGGSFNAGGQISTQVAGNTTLLATVDTDFFVGIYNKNNGITITDTKIAEVSQSAGFPQFTDSDGAIDFDPNSHVTIGLEQSQAALGTTSLGLLDPAQDGGTQMALLDYVLPDATGPPSSTDVVGQVYQDQAATAAADSEAAEQAAREKAEANGEEFDVEAYHAAQEGETAPAANPMYDFAGSKVDVGIPSAQDGAAFAYLDDLQLRDALTIQEMQLVEHAFFDETVTLNPAFQALLATVIMPYALGANGLGLLATGQAGGALTALQAASNAAISSVATGVVSGAITGDMDLGEILKGAVMSAISAGAVQGITNSLMGGVAQFDVAGEVMRNASGEVVMSTGLLSDFVSTLPTESLLGFSNGAFSVENLVTGGINGAVTAGVNSLIYDTDFGDAFAAALVSTATNELMVGFQGLIGDNLNHTNANGDVVEGIMGEEGSLAHVLSHAAVGCVTAALSDADCGAGAIGGAAQALYAGAVASDPNAPKPGEPGYAAWQATATANAHAIGAVAGYVVSGGEAANVTSAASIAQSGFKNNYLTHAEAEQLDKCLADLDMECVNRLNDLHTERHANLMACNGDSSDQCQAVRLGLRLAIAEYSELEANGFPALSSAQFFAHEAMLEYGNYGGGIDDPIFQVDGLKSANAIAVLGQTREENELMVRSYVGAAGAQLATLDGAGFTSFIPSAMFDDLLKLVRGVNPPTGAAGATDELADWIRTQRRTIDAADQEISGVATNNADDVFRGTTEGFEGGPNTVSTGSTPTSSDPLVSTCYSVNACNTNGGTGVVHVVDPNIADEVIDDYYGSLPHDLEVILEGVTPSQVADSASQTIPTSQAVDAFNQMGITVPSTTGPGQLDSALQELMQNGTTPLSPEQVQEFLDLTGGSN